jgi:1-acyl-sn-glycerol-3-phosphate acyltransferase
VSVLKQLFFALVVRPTLLVALGVNVRRRELLPERGPAIVVANHNSHLDTAVLMTLLPWRELGRVRPVAAADYFLANRLVAWFSLKVIGIVPIERQGATDPLAPVREALAAGAILILFPEGTRGEPERMAELKSGIGRLAVAFPEVPVTPVFLRGLGKVLPRGAVLPVPFFSDVFVGQPLSGGDPAVAGDHHRFVELLRERLLALAEEDPAPAWE